MRLFAAIVPPRAVLEEVARAVPSPSASTDSAPPRRGLFRRSAGRGAHTSDRPVHVTAPNDELDLPDVDKMYIPITSFGNVTLGDSLKLANAMRAEVATWRRPDVRFHGGAALEFPGDESVWAKLTGDIDDLMTIGRGVPLVVQRLGFFVDRRQFRPWLSVGTITDHTTAPYLETVVAALDALEGEQWTVDSVWLMQRPPESTGPLDFTPMERMPLAGH